MSVTLVRFLLPHPLYNPDENLSSGNCHIVPQNFGMTVFM